MLNYNTHNRQNLFTNDFCYSLISVNARNEQRQFVHRSGTDKGKIKAHHCQNKSLSENNINGRTYSCQTSISRYRQWIPKQPKSQVAAKDFDKLTTLVWQSNASTKKNIILIINIYNIFWSHWPRKLILNGYKSSFKQSRENTNLKTVDTNV